MMSCFGTNFDANFKTLGQFENVFVTMSIWGNVRLILKYISLEIRILFNSSTLVEIVFGLV